MTDPRKPGFTLLNLDQVEDAGAVAGFGERWEARVARDDLDAEATGLTHFRLHPGKRSPFAHRHRVAEEIYVILRGQGRIKLGDEIVEVGELDAIRVAPEVSRAFEAGPAGLEFIACGARHPDGERVDDAWVEEPPAVEAPPEGAGERVEGTFEVVSFLPTEIEPEPAITTGLPVGLAKIEKRMTGAVEGRAATLFSTAYDQASGVGTYVALESFEGSLGGRSGAFNFVHSAATTGAERTAEHFAIVPGSGTGELEGISGSGGIAIDDDGTHRIWFDFSLG